MKNELLYKGFDNIPSRKGRGGTYSYVRWQDVADRMNDAFGTGWSSELVGQTITGNNIVVRVKVTIIDRESGTLFCQEGFGGAINDEKSEVGNPFKSAYSKALKDACKKWGIGLYLEEDGEGHVSNIPTGYMGKEYGIPPAEKEATSTSMPAQSTMPIPPGVTMTPQSVVIEVESTPVEEEPVPFVPQAPPVVSVPVPPQAKVEKVQTTMVPPVAKPATPPVPKKTAKSTPSVPSVPKAPTVPTVPSTPAQQPMQMPASVNLSAGEKPLTSKSAAINLGEPEYISDVQKAALYSILNIKGVEYEALAAEAFQANGVVKSPIPAPDDLTYQEAVYVVKYGNDKFRRH